MNLSEKTVTILRRLERWRHQPERSVTMLSLFDTALIAAVLLIPIWCWT